MGFLWTIYLDGEMNLLPQGVAIAELDGDDVSAADRAELTFDADLLMSEGRQASGLKRFVPASVRCVIDTVEVRGRDSQRKVLVQGDSATIAIETSVESGDVKISAREIEQ
jgi:hypothetical protein